MSSFHEFHVSFDFLVMLRLNGIRSCPSRAINAAQQIRTVKSAPKFHVLTSTAIATTHDGFYPWNVVQFLTPKEAIRRELIRGGDALNAFNLIRKPWQVYCFSEWFDSFLVPIIKEHNDTEDKVVFEFYQKLDVKVPSRHQADHTVFPELLDMVSKRAKELHEMTSNEDVNVDPQLVSNKTEELRKAYFTLKDFTWIHFKQEELYWPGNILEHGELYLRCASLEWVF